MAKEASVSKIFVLDTNILLSTSGDALTGFDDNDVVITTTTLEELDNLKDSKRGDVGYDARESARKIYALSDDGRYDLHDGVKLPGGGIFKLEPNGQDASLLPAGMSLDKADNRILSSAKTIAKENPDRQVILVTNDILMLLKAISAGVKAQTYRNAELSSDEIYTGFVEMWMNDADINSLYQTRRISIATVSAEESELYENEYVILKGYEGASALGIYTNGYIELLPNELQAYGVTPKNAKQSFAIHALLSDTPMVILQGIAGSGKTLLAIAAGMHGVFKDDKYDSMLYTRNNVLFDEDIGFLPGDEQQKMSALCRPLMDNLKLLLAINGSEPTMIKQQIDDYIYSGLISIESMAYMRGRSIYKSFVVIDEAQNATPRQIRGLCTRPSELTKIVLTGDPTQVDNPYLSARSNGLSFASARMKGAKNCSQVAFFDSNECIRCDLVKEAAERLVVDKS